MVHKCTNPDSVFAMVAGQTTATNLRAQTRSATRPEVARKTAAASGEETRGRIIAAAVETLNAVGIVGASARTIARTGDFNQALIFYHFGSVEGLLVAAAKTEGVARSARYAEKFGQVSTIAELVTIARSVHQQEQSDGAVNVLSQLLAGSMSPSRVASIGASLATLRGSRCTCGLPPGCTSPSLRSTRAGSSIRGSSGPASK